LINILYVLAQDNICDKYSKALKLTNQQLITAIVNGTVGKIVSAKSPIKVYFDGTKPPGSTNYLQDADALAGLIKSLVSFFGDALSCPDGTIAPYSGPKMDKVHQRLGISIHESTFFNDQVIAVLAGFGVEESDQVAVRITLNTLREAIVFQNSVCDRYARLLKVTDKDLVTQVVKGTVAKVTATGTPTRKYFDGTKPAGSLNFLDPANKRSLDGLLNGLINFFGVALSCNDGSLAPYFGPTLRNAHRIMGIDTNEFDFFNNQVIDVLRGAGVAKMDLTAVHKILNNTKSEIVTNA